MSQKDMIYVEQLFKFTSKPKLWEEPRNGMKLQRQVQFINNQKNTLFSKIMKRCAYSKLRKH